MLQKIDQTTKEVGTMERDYARERIRVEKGEIIDIEVEGTKEYVERRTEEHLARFGSRRVISGQARKVDEKQNQTLLPGFAADDAPVLDQSTSASDDHVDIPAEEHHTETSTDLVSLYSALFPSGNPKSQYDVISLVTYYYQHYKSYTSLTLNDYSSAFLELRRAAIEQPENLRSSIKNSRTAKYLFSPEDGKFALTTKGEAHIKSLMGS